MTKVSKMNVENPEISVLVGENQGDYICLTDMARYKDNDPALIISHWMRSLNTLDYLGAWEMMHNPNFKPTEFGRFKTEAGYNAFTMSPKKWIESTNATLAKKGLNIRDTATINQLAVLSSIESMNAELIKRNVAKSERLAILRKMAIEQLESMNKHHVEQRFQKLIEEANKPKAIGE